MVPGDFPARFVGAQDVLNSKKVAILNSRQSKFPVGADSWIPATAKAVRYAVQSSYTIISSIGMNTWEIVITLASREKGKLVVIVPAPESNEEYRFIDICHDYSLDPDKTALVLLDRTNGKKDWQRRRDEFIANQADVLMPISIKSGGNLQKYLETYWEKILRRYQIEYKQPSRKRPDYNNLSLNPRLFEAQLIVHFTRSRGGPWPGETRFDYYSDIIQSNKEYCRSAKNVLKRILKSGKISASDRGIRGGYKVVGFSAISRENLLEMFRYRPRMVNPYFEPYGIAMEKMTAVDLGFRPVIYGTPEVYPHLKESDYPYFQNPGSHDMQWLPEQEWRYAGDFELEKISPEDLYTIVTYPREVGDFLSLSPGKIVPAAIDKARSNS